MIDNIVFISGVPQSDSASVDSLSVLGSVPCADSRSHCFGGEKQKQTRKGCLGQRAEHSLALAVSKGTGHRAPSRPTKPTPGTGPGPWAPAGLTPMSPGSHFSSLVSVPPHQVADGGGDGSGARPVSLPAPAASDSCAHSPWCRPQHSLKSRRWFFLAHLRKAQMDLHGGHVLGCLRKHGSSLQTEGGLQEGPAPGLCPPAHPPPERPPAGPWVTPHPHQVPAPAPSGWGTGPGPP